MLRKVFFVLVLATLAATTAAASSVRPVKAHGHAGLIKRPHRRAHVAQHPSNHRPKGPSHPRTAHPTIHHKTTRHPARPKIKPAAVSHGARLQPVSLRRSRIIMPPPLRGSLESLQRQNDMADAEGLERILDEQDLSNRIAQKLLVPLPESSALTVNDDLPDAHRYCRPWTAVFLRDLARAHNARFQRPIEVSSAVRTVEYQKRLMRINGNAAAAEGDIVSPHLTGATIDVAKGGMSREELGWMRSWLLRLQLAGKIDVAEEFRQACFHITVYKTYVPSEQETPLRKAVRGSESEAQDTPGGF